MLNFHLRLDSKSVLQIDIWTAGAYTTPCMKWLMMISYEK